MLFSENQAETSGKTIAGWWVLRIGAVDKLHKSTLYGIINLEERDIHDGTNRRADADDSNGFFKLDTGQSLGKKIAARISFVYRRSAY